MLSAINTVATEPVPPPFDVTVCVTHVCPPSLVLNISGAEPVGASLIITPYVSSGLNNRIPVMNRAVPPVRSTTLPLTPPLTVFHILAFGPPSPAKIVSALFAHTQNSSLPVRLPLMFTKLAPPLVERYTLGLLLKPPASIIVLQSGTDIVGKLPRPRAEPEHIAHWE